MRIGSFVALGWLSLCAVAVAAELGRPIDLSNFSEMDSVLSAPDGGLPIEEVTWEPEIAHRRLYISGIIGDSFETFAYTGYAPTGSVFTAGGAAGVAFDRPAGAVRLEFEGRGRGNGPRYETNSSDVFYTHRYTENWSTLINAWRDVAITERLGLYAGGGLGAGGFRRSLRVDAPGIALITGTQPVTSFAWQAGGGVIHQVSNRVTLDLGYRFYALQPCQYAFFSNSSGGIAEWSPATLSASEFLLSVRVYEPFRIWR